MTAVNRDRAAHLWPLVKHDGRAEAALIAYHGLRPLHQVAGELIEAARPRLAR